MRHSILFLLLMASTCLHAIGHGKYNFNSGWLLRVGDIPEAQSDIDDSRWQRVTLPYAFNGGEAFRKDITELTDTVVWYRKISRLAMTTRKARCSSNLRVPAREPTYGSTARKWDSPTMA